eukprot:2320979-Rhodomonas_salina.2
MLADTAYCATGACILQYKSAQTSTPVQVYPGTQSPARPALVNREEAGADNDRGIKAKTPLSAYSLYWESACVHLISPRARATCGHRHPVQGDCSAGFTPSRADFRPGREIHTRFHLGFQSRRAGFTLSLQFDGRISNRTAGFQIGSKRL